MKQLFLFRHGKSSWDTQGLSDYDRPLLHKGQQRTAKVAKHLLDMGALPDLMVTSPAVRASQTAMIVAEILGFPVEKVLANPSLYLASPDQIWDVIIALPDSAGKVILFGHNTGFTEFINLSGIARLDWLPTSGVASASFSCDHWYDCPSLHPTNTSVTWPAILK